MAKAQDIIKSLLPAKAGELTEEQILKAEDIISVLEKVAKLPGGKSARNRIEQLKNLLLTDKTVKQEQQIKQFETNLSQFRQEFKTKREETAVQLEQQLSNQANIEYETLFRPQIRQMLAAKGILEGGAERELEAKYRTQLQAPVAQRVAEYRLGTEEADLSLGLSGLQAKLGLQKENTIQQFNEFLAGVGNEFMSDIARISKPSSFLNFAQLLPIALSGYTGNTQQMQAGQGNIFSGSQFSLLEPTQDLYK